MISEYRYDLVGNVVEANDAMDFTSRRWYTATGQLASEIDGDGILNTYTYNAFGEVSQTTNDRQLHLNYSGATTPAVAQ